MELESNILGNSDCSKPQDNVLEEAILEVSYEEQEQHR